MGVILLKHPWEFVEGENLPDIFTAEYTELIESRAAELCPPAKDNPLVMGYYYGFGAFNHSDYWVNQYLCLPPGSEGRDELVEILMKRYDNDAEKFNSVYGTSVRKISDLKDSEVLSYDKVFEKRNYPKIRPKLDPVILGDFEAILDHMAITLYKIGYDAIKKWDTNHLIFGNFVKEFAFSEQTWKAAAPYVDMIAPQHVNLEVSAHKMAEAAGLPIFFSDDYFGWHYPGGKGSRHAGLVSHDARGEVYKANLTRHLKDPKALGVTYCCCMYDQGGNTLKKNNQNGLHDINGVPREKLIADITEINKQIYTLAAEPANPAELAELDKILYDTWAENATGRPLWDIDNNILEENLERQKQNEE